MTPAPAVHVAVATLNQTVGDWAGNRDRIVAALQIARARGAVLVALPEMAVSGYSLGDRVWMPGTLERSWASVLEILPHTAGLVTFLGLPVAHQGALYDAVVVAVDGRAVAVVPKENLATGDVEYENRWYAGWQRGRVDTFTAPDGQQLPMGSLVFDSPTLGRFAVEVCEDGWKGSRPGAIAALCGARIVVNASASWFVLGKHRVRRELCAAVSREDHTAYLYSSLLGCDATRLVFDGTGIIAVDGQIAAEAPRFVFTEDVVVLDHTVDLAELDRQRLTEGSWRHQADALHAGALGGRPTVLTVPAVPVPVRPAPPPPPYWADAPAAAADASLAWLVDAGLFPSPMTPADLPHLELELALCTGLRDYVRKSGVAGFALALSGGRDSSMCAVLVQRMLRYAHPDLSPEALRARVREQLVTAYLATAHSGDATETAARALAEQIGAEHLTAEIQEAVDLHRRLVGGMVGAELSWAEPAHDVPLQNVQARLRGSLIWFVANLKGRLLLTTSNKTEAAVGYATMDGDTSGGLAPIADVPKSLIGPWLQWAMARHGLTSLAHVLQTPATAELRPASSAQTDEGDLMPFAVLDRLIYHFAYLGEEPVTIARRLWPEFTLRYGGDPAAFAAHVRKFVRLFCAAQWKRERFAISFRVGVFDLDPKYGFRFPPVQAPFTEELAELDGWVAEARAATSAVQALDDHA